jgi:hypothetical protein
LSFIDPRIGASAARDATDLPMRGVLASHFRHEADAEIPESMASASCDVGSWARLRAPLCSFTAEPSSAKVRFVDLVLWYGMTASRFSTLRFAPLR